MSIRGEIQLRNYMAAVDILQQDIAALKARLELLELPKEPKRLGRPPKDKNRGN